MNLLQETIGIIKDHGHNPKEVIWVGNRHEYAISWDEFEKIADIEYDDSWGAAEIAQDLIVCGNDFYLTRWEYDGSEGWQFNEQPETQPKRKPFKFVTGNAMWPSLDELNNDEALLSNREHEKTPHDPYFFDCWCRNQSIHNRAVGEDNA